MISFYVLIHCWYIFCHKFAMIALNIGVSILMLLKLVSNQFICTTCTVFTLITFEHNWYYWLYCVLIIVMSLQIFCSMNSLVINQIFLPRTNFLTFFAIKKFTVLRELYRLIYTGNFLLNQGNVYDIFSNFYIKRFIVMNLNVPVIVVSLRKNMVTLSALKLDLLCMYIAYMAIHILFTICAEFTIKTSELQ